ncbi:hypothetical protein MH215_04980 [Paenibacillus sp. ACRSA]|uniref:hypothetical protein n=1 Tax=Paenibacillus sp. ACRSA TaxID=2918211 RepID=UPI001EF5DC56|nr:hypothetical protein [Paenibacillus sp. ACRSA]MCG7376336.1 hypothetical protein [Paenibacillus sp. ACRSA]
MLDPGSSKFSSPASPLPAHELKILQEYIHHQNVQIIGEINPLRRKEIMLSNFFKSHKNQTVKLKVHSRNQFTEMMAKTEAVGRDFVILTTLLTKYWVPFRSIVTAEQPFDQVNVPHQQHQQVVYDEDLKQKILLKFGKTVSQKDFLKQQFFEQTLAGHIKSLMNDKLIVETSTARIRSRLLDINAQEILLKEKGGRSSVPWSDILWIEKQRFI